MAKTVSKVGALVLALTLLCGCAGKPQAAPEEETVKPTESQTDAPVGEEQTDTKAVDDVFSVYYDAGKSFNPIRSTSANNMQLRSLLYDFLFDLDVDGTLSSELVTSYTTEDNAWWTFQIDTSIPFTDGSTLTAQDVSYSIRQATQSTVFGGRLAVIYGVSALDDETLAISTKYPDSRLPELLNIPIIKSGSGTQDVPAGTGPYMLSEEGDRLIQFSENRHAAQMPVDTIYLKSYDDISDMIAGFENSAIDIVTNDPTSVLNLGYGSSNETRLYDTSNLQFVGFNMRSSFFQSSASRFAVTYAVDRASIVSGSMLGNAVATTLPVGPNNALYDGAYAGRFNYDLDRCAALFEQAEVKDHDDDGKLEFLVTGIVVEINIDFIVNNDSAAKVNAARKIAEALTSIGITTTLRELNWSEYQQALQNGEYDMYYGEVKLSADDNLAFLFDESRDMNYAQCADTGYSELYYAYLNADASTRYDAFQQACHYLVENGGIVPVCFERKQVITHRNVVTGMAPTQYDIFNKFADWTINLK